MLRKLVKWFAILIGLTLGGIAIATVVMSVAESPVARHLPAFRWWSWAAYTVLLFAVTINAFRSEWKQPQLWRWIAILLLLHSAGFTWLLSAVEEWRLVWFVPLIIAEFQGFAYILYLVVQRPRFSSRSPSADYD